MKHFGFALIGVVMFFIITLITLKFTKAGIQTEGLKDAILLGGIMKSILVTACWIGFIAGGLSSLVFRKSENQKIYVWIVLIFILIFTEVVISTVY
jgi:hypothetical protein